MDSISHQANNVKFYNYNNLLYLYFFSPLSPKIHYIFNNLLFTNIKKYDTIL